MCASPPLLATTAALLALSFCWAYSSTLGRLVTAWNQQPDYSHGYLVPPLALFFLWHARRRFPGWHTHWAWPGLALVLISVALRWFGGYYYLEPIDTWSIPVWFAGVAWMLGGWACTRWSLPAIAFLYFMMPLPFSMERWLSVPLRAVATRLSTWSLQCLGQPAIAQGHTIYLSEHQLEVEDACSGLRMLVGVAALAVAYVITCQRSWWERALLLASVIPVALTANAARITITGMLYKYASSEAAVTFTHDLAGIVMIVIAAALFAAVLWYLNVLFPEQQVLDVGELLRGAEGDDKPALASVGGPVTTVGLARRAGRPAMFSGSSVQSLPMSDTPSTLESGGSE